jgi:hypothetical protein
MNGLEMVSVLIINDQRASCGDFFGRTIYTFASVPGKYHKSGIYGAMFL